MSYNDLRYGTWIIGSKCGEGTENAVMIAAQTKIVSVASVMVWDGISLTGK